MATRPEAQPSGRPLDARSREARRERERGLDRAPEHMTALQRHCAFFDRDGDGRLSPRDTYLGCRALGYGRVVSGLLAATINPGVGWVTASFPRPTLYIDLARIHRVHHGSDTGIYDERGDFVPERFERMFDRYDRDGDGALGPREIWARCRGDRDLYDLVGQTAAVFEFALTFMIAAEDGKLTKETIRALYDGTLFYEVEARRRRSGAR